MILPMVKRSKQYEILYVDPPWQYNDKGIQGAAEKHYPTMSVAELCALPIQKIAAPDSVLFMWATYPTLPDALKVMAAWGFAYKTIGFQWVKLNKKQPTPFYGLGHWTRGNTEPCFIGVRGGLRRANNAVFQLHLDEEVVCSPLGAHSKKPDIIREKIVSLMGDRPRVELFARNTTPGWDVWGNEVKSDLVLKG